LLFILRSTLRILLRIDDLAAVRAQRVINLRNMKINALRKIEQSKRRAISLMKAQETKRLRQIHVTTLNMLGRQLTLRI